MEYGLSDQPTSSDTLEPTTKVLWNMGVCDQPTSSDTRARAQKGKSGAPQSRAAVLMGFGMTVK
jgi:Icc-related predicted phosphoesterase